jgi:hypothetical protein
MPPITYSQLVVVRVSHRDPTITGNAAMVLRQELERIVPLWTEQIAEPLKPTMEVIPDIGLTGLHGRHHPC